MRRSRLPLKRVRIFAIGIFLFVFAQVASGATPPTDACNLPQDLEREIAIKYPGTAVVRLWDLVDDDRRFFQKDHGDACPGLVKVDFYGDGKPALALLLTQRRGASEPTKLIGPSRRGDMENGPFGHRGSEPLRASGLEPATGRIQGRLWQEDNPSDSTRDCLL